jgi:hypothetical protein
MTERKETIAAEAHTKTSKQSNGAAASFFNFQFIIKHSEPNNVQYCCVK